MTDFPPISASTARERQDQEGGVNTMDKYELAILDYLDDANYWRNGSEIRNGAAVPDSVNVVGILDDFLTRELIDVSYTGVVRHFRIAVAGHALVSASSPAHDESEGA